MAALPFAHWNADVIRVEHLLRIAFESLIIAEYKPEVKESSVFSPKQELETLTDAGHVQACLHGEIRSFLVCDSFCICVVQVYFRSCVSELVCDPSD